MARVKENSERLMRTVFRHPRHFKPTDKVGALSSPIPRIELVPENPSLSEELYSKELDQYPDVKTLKTIHSKLIIYQNLHYNPSLGVKLMRAYAFHGETKLTRQLFDQIPHKNTILFNVMIRSYVNNKTYDQALLVFRDMPRSGFLPDNYTYPCVLKACSASYNLRVGLQIHGWVRKLGLDSNLFVGNGLVAMYGKCSRLADARRVLDEMPRKDLVSWNSMVTGFAQNSNFDEAIEVCREMESLGLKPNAGTMASLMPALTNTSLENISYLKDIFVSSVRKSLVSWNVMIAVHVNNSMPREALDLFLNMESHGIEPDSVTIASILPAIGDLSALVMGKKLHELVERERLRPNLLLENALMDMYAKCGCLREAREVFERMRTRDVVSWTSLISAYGRAGKGHEAVKLFEEMLGSGQTPDSVAFVSVISACSHSGLLEEGKRIFKAMTEEYSITPRLEHYSCTIDLLGRAGKLEEAYGLVKSMPIEPNERVWGALLSACKIHNDTRIGVVAADNLFRLAPNQAGYYVLLSNIYARAEKWDEVEKVRISMKMRGIKKSPGFSNVEVDNKVHTFLAGDTSHPRSEEIYEELSVMVGRMKELGYVPEIDSALHDVEEEDKEHHLAVHSEKLAVVFGIMNLEPGVSIRITKNLRVCGDCHAALKLISRIVRREIVVRDTHRFHHFEDGVCSCGDYW